MNLGPAPVDCSLNPLEKQALLRIARTTVVATVEGRRPDSLDLAAYSERLRGLGASFVTLLHFGALRGCLGSLQPERPLAEDVRQHAIAVCASDYRFPPVQPEEVPGLSLDVSVLSPTHLLEYASPDDLLGRLRPGVDGVLLRAGTYRATFLPKVWERVTTPDEFLGMLCRKAGLPADSWRRDRLEISTYTVEEFQE
jgi:AmmeMemoRadiSam system protein A